MNKNTFTISGITAGIVVVMLLLTVGTGATSSIILLNTAYAQKAQSASPTLGEPIFVEKGGDVIQKEIGPNRSTYTFTSNGTLNGTIEYSKAGEYVSVSKGNNQTFDQGHGVIMTKDGETANYTFIEVFNGTDYQGASAYSTNSTGVLSFLNNILLIFKGGADESGNYALEQWHWK
ncbi:MAG TPA: hypothetical protein VGE97_10585 [Nitrososphaera sp.]